MGTNTVMVLSAVTVVMIIAPTIAAVVMVVIVAGAVVAVIRMRVVVVHSSRRETTGRPMVRPTLTVRRSRSIVVIVIVVAIIVAIGRMLLLLLTMIVLRVDSQLVRLPITQLGSFPVSAFKVIEWLWCQVHGGFLGSRHEVLAMIRLAFLSAPPADCREKTAKQKTNQTMNKPVFRKRQYRSGKQK